MSGPQKNPAKYPAPETGAVPDLGMPIFWLVAVFAFFWALGDWGLGGSEGRWAEVSREMLLKKDFFHPTINWEPYFDKPLFSYWFVVAFNFVIGSLGELTARAPSAIAGLIALWATMRLGRQLWSEGVARLAGWLMLSCFGVLLWSRTAAADMENVAAITLAVAWFWTRHEKPGFLTYFVFYLICVVGAHTKGLPAIAVPIVAIMPFVLREGQWKNHLRVSHVLAGLAAIAVYALPFLYESLTRDTAVYASSGFELAWRENVVRAIKPFDHKEPFYVYTYYVPELLLPWSLLFVAALAGIIPAYRKLDARTRWLLEAIAVIFLLFSASGSRRVYYIMPIVPFCALLMAVYLCGHWKTKLREWTVRVIAWVFVTAATLEILLAASWLVLSMANPELLTSLSERLGLGGYQPPKVLVLESLLLGALALWVFMRARQPAALRIFAGQREAAPVLAAGTVMMAGFFACQMPLMDVYRTERPFAAKLSSLVNGLKLPAQNIAFFYKDSTNLLFYLGVKGPVTVLADDKAAEKFLASDIGDKIILSQERYMEKLLPLLPEGIRESPFVVQDKFPWEEQRPSKSNKLCAWVIMDPAIKDREAAEKSESSQNKENGK